MDVVALAQHGVEYAVATLGTATTPVHAQKLFRADRLASCSASTATPPDARPRGARSRTPCRSWPTARTRVFLFLPDGEDPDDFVRQRGKAAFEQALAKPRCRCPNSCSPSSSARHPPTSAEGRAALVAAARPLLGADRGARCWRRSCASGSAELSGLPEAELREPAGASDDGGGPPGARNRPTVGRPRVRSLTRAAGVRRRWLRQLIRGLLLQPALAKALPFPRPDERTPEATRLTALVALLRRGRRRRRRTAGVSCRRSPTRPHARGVRVGARRPSRTTRLDDAAIEAEVRDGLDRWWQQARRTGIAGPRCRGAGRPGEEDRRAAAARLRPAARGRAGGAPGPRRRARRTFRRGARP